MLANTPVVKLANRRGVSTIELLLVTPILIVVLVAVVELSLFISVRQQIVAASAQGSRAATQGATDKEIEEVVRKALGDGILSETVEVETDLFDDSGKPVPPGEPVTVTVSVDAQRVVPDLLSIIGFSIKDKQIVGRTIMRKE
jgi:hypothetical protein